MSVAIVLMTAVVALMLIFLFKYRYKNRHIIAAAKKLPCPTTIPILGNALIFIGGVRTLHKILISLTAQFKEVYCIWIGLVPIFVVSRPSDVQVVLNSSTTIEKDEGYNYLKPFMGNCLLVSPAPIWRKYRRLISPMLHPTTIESYLPIFNSASRKMVDKFGETTKLDPRYDIFKLSLDTASKTLLGRQVVYSEDAKERLYYLFDMIGTMAVDRLLKPWLQIDWVFHLLYKERFEKSVEGICKLKELYEQVVKEYSDERKAMEESTNETCEPEKHLAYLSYTVPEEVNEDHTWWDEATNAIVGATDSSISVFSFFLLSIAIQPEVQTRIRNEIQQVMGDSNRDVTTKDIDSLTYLNQALKESMRLHGVFPFILRRATKDTKLANATLPAGSRIIIPLHAMGWDTDSFPEPHKYDPDRFSPENIRKRHKYSFIPFSAGPRNCIGKQFSTILMKTVLVHILRKFEVRTSMRMEDIDYEIKVVVYCKSPIPLEFVAL